MRMADLIGTARLRELFRYYSAAAANTAFGYGLYALLVHFGANIYLAQITAHVTGTAFNYFTYSRHAFRGSSAAKGRFIAAYAASYVVNLSLLALFDQIIRSPYGAGLAALVAASLLNYFVLKNLVFTARRAGI